MNYRDKLLNQQNKNQITQLETKWQQERNILQQDIINLQNSTDIKLLEQAQEKSKELEEELQKEKDLLNKTINLLGSSDIKNLTDLSNLLQGKSLKELVNEKELNHSLLTKKITDLETQLLTLAKQKIKGKRDAEKVLNELETNWSKKEIEWETERTEIQGQQEKERDNWTSEMAKSKEIITNLEKELFKQKARLDHEGKEHERLRKVLDQDKFELTRRLEQAQKDISQKEQTIIGLNESYNKLEEEIKELTEKLARETEKKVQYKGDLVQLTKEHKKLKDDYQKLEEGLRNFLNRYGISSGKLVDLDKYIEYLKEEIEAQEKLLQDKDKKGWW